MERRAPDIRPALVADCQALTALCFESKASNGYDAAFMEACREELAVQPDLVAGGDFFVAERDGQIIGCAGLEACDEPDMAEVSRFFIAPKAKRQGVGQTLWRHLLHTARGRGLHKLTLAADPHAVPFYEAMGFQVTGETPSESIPGRRLPVMQREIS